MRVIEIAHIIMGPANADCLGEFGAEVIKIELPGTGDNIQARRSRPALRTETRATERRHRQ